MALLYSAAMVAATSSNSLPAHMEQLLEVSRVLDWYGTVAVLGGHGTVTQRALAPLHLDVLDDVLKAEDLELWIAMIGWSVESPASIWCHQILFDGRKWCQKCSLTSKQSAAIQVEVWEALVIAPDKLCAVLLPFNRVSPFQRLCSPSKHCPGCGCGGHQQGPTRWVCVCGCHRPPRGPAAHATDI
eukprot:1138877-Pelagomonas_calceolata.AAC.4